MAFRTALRIGVPKLPLRSCTNTIHYTYSIRSSLCIVAQERYTQKSCTKLNTRAFSNKSSNKDDHDEEEMVGIIYEGPFASLALKLKRVSLTSAVIAIVGLPALTVFSNASIPASGQLAVIGTAGLTAVGSTVLLGYCFSPYVHSIERLPLTTSNHEDVATNVNDDANKHLVKIITRDILAREVETIFDPATDVSPPPSNISRPFCNFLVKNTSGSWLPAYVHPELVHDDKLRMQLVGEPPQVNTETMQKKTKVDDDEFL